MCGSALADGLELSCIFAEGSQAQSCILKVCRVKNGTVVHVPCKNITISREDQAQPNGQLTNLQPGVYVVREVAEVESDGQVTIHRTKDVLELVITESQPSATFTTPGCLLIKDNLNT